MLIYPGVVPCRWAGFGYAELDPEKYLFSNRRFLMEYFDKEARESLFVEYRKRGCPDDEEIIAALDAKTIENTGIQSRYIFFDGTVEELAAKAVEMALRHAGCAPAEVDCIVVGRNTGTQFASTADHVKRHLGIPKRAMAHDVQEACTGGMVAMQTACEKIWTGSYRCVVAVGVDRATQLTPNNVFENANLFGDGAFAIVMERGESGDQQVIASDFESDPHDNKHTWIVRDEEIGFRQIGKRVHPAVATTISRRIKEFLEAIDIDPASISAQYTHQPSLKTIEFTNEWTEKLVPSLKPRRRPISVVRYGNMSAASVGDLICRDVHNGELRDGDLVLVDGFGASMNDGHILWTYRNWW